MKRNLYTFLLVSLFAVSLTAQPNAGPLTITHFAGIDNPTAGNSGDFQVEQTIHIEGEYGNFLNANWVRVTYDVYKPDWTGFETPNVEVFHAHIDSTGLADLDGTINMDFVIPEGSLLTADFPDHFPIIQIRVEYDPAEDTYWNYFVTVGPATGTKFVPNLPGLEVYPNPATNGLVNIATPNGLEKSITVYDAAGKLHHSGSLNGNGQYDISNVPAGFYLMLVEEDGKVGYHKLIVE